MIMLPNHGKFLIYFSQFSGLNKRFRTIVNAVVRLAEKLRTDIELSQKKSALSVWVY